MECCIHRSGLHCIFYVVCICTVDSDILIGRTRFNIVLCTLLGYLVESHDSISTIQSVIINRLALPSLPGFDQADSTMLNRGEAKVEPFIYPILSFLLLLLHSPPKQKEALPVSAFTIIYLTHLTKTT